MRLRRLPLGDVAQGEIGGDARGAPTAKEAVEVREPTLQLAQVLPPTRRLVVRAQIGRDLVVEDAVDPGRDRRPRGGGALAQLEEALRLGLFLGAGALAHRTAVHVVLDPPHTSRRAIPRLLLVQVTHQLLLSPAARGGFGTWRNWLERPCRVRGRDVLMFCRPRCSSSEVHRRAMPRTPYGVKTSLRPLLASGLPDIDETVELQFVEEQLPQFCAARERHSDAFQDPSGLEIPDCPRRNAEIVGCGPKVQKPGRDELARRGTLGGALRNPSTRMRHWVREFTVASAPLSDLDEDFSPVR